MPFCELTVTRQPANLPAAYRGDVTSPMIIDLRTGAVEFEEHYFDPKSEASIGK